MAGRRDEEQGGLTIHAAQEASHDIDLGMADRPACRRFLQICQRRKRARDHPGFVENPEQVRCEWADLPRPSVQDQAVGEVESDQCCVSDHPAFLERGCHDS